MDKLILNILLKYIPIEKWDLALNLIFGAIFTIPLLGFLATIIVFTRAMIKYL
jgi:hypothetical protein